MSKISELKNRYDGERVFLIGNGPSLKDTPLEELNSEYTFGVNKINKLYDSRGWSPTFFFTGTLPTSSLFPPLDSEQNPINYHVKSSIPCILPDGAFDFYGDQTDIYYYNKFWLLENSSPFHQMSIEDVKKIDIDHLKEYWSSDISNVIYLYHSMYGLAQVAAYLGFDKIYFVGTDLGLEYINPHMIFHEGLDPYRFDGNKSKYIKQAGKQGVLLKSLINGMAMKLIQNSKSKRFAEKLLGNAETSHFTSQYIDSIKINDGPRYNNELTKSHYAIKRMCEYHGINVYNATVGGDLEVYPRVEIDSIL